ncbi:SPX [Macleaya cordata]|uniref:SPX n=1 Tax=Macleaya cordata TaxID=56857 RepID=A0A200QBB7_MACCD|nr:SPX [Macleaya cordata]
MAVVTMMDLFGKSLSNQIEETLPEWRDKFLSYKELKKQLKLIDPKIGEERSSKRPRLADGDCTISSEEEMKRMSREEIDFIRLLEKELDKFNWFFVDKEEEYIIRLKELQDRVAKAKESNEELIKARKEIVDFHGEMVLLENYSALNYTGLVKILKKYDKRTGALIRLPFIQKVLQQPFFTTDLLYKLVKECEIMLDHLFPINEPSVPTTETADSNEGCPTTPTTTAAAAATKKDGLLLRGTKELAEIEYMESLYMKSTVSALRVLKEIRKGSSTVSVFSLPPMQTCPLEDTWNKIPVLEQTAK